MTSPSEEETLAPDGPGPSGPGLASDEATLPPAGLSGSSVPSDEETIAPGGPIRGDEATMGAPDVSRSGGPRATDAMKRVSELRMGRFRVERHLGSGAMGQVFLVEDTDLGRQVALKLIDIEGGVEANPEGLQRTLREARALAKVDHPNVVKVYDVGTMDDAVYIAMEFVRGTTLRDFVGEDHSLPEILTVFTQAGRGLAAAHAAGLVHRDFKPDNALVGEDGRVRVVDFGLARADVDEADEDASVPEVPDLDFLETTGAEARTDPALRAHLTRTGAWMGTPAYMAPEQYKGRKADARSDQFSFTVALYEALHGVRPFAAENLYQLADAVAKGRVTEKGDRRLPPWLSAALRRGLSVEPEQRFPSMDVLSDALDPALRRARRLRWGAAAGVVAVATVTALLARGGGSDPAVPPDPCPDATPMVEPVWNETRAQVVRDRFVATGKPYARFAAEQVETTLNGYRNAWVEGRERACTATHVEGSQSSELLDLRMRCLDRRKGELQELVTLLEEADEKLVKRSANAVAGLPRVSDCDDVEHISAGFQQPSDPEQAALAAEVIEVVDRAQADVLAANYDRAQELLDGIAESVTKLEHKPTRAEYRMVLGNVTKAKGDAEKAEKTFLDATTDAEASQHDKVAAQVWLNLAHLKVSKEDAEKGGFYLQRAEAAVGRLGDPPHMRERLEQARSKQLYAAGDYDGAMKALEAAMALTEAAESAPQKAGQIANQMGRIHYARGQHGDAVKAFQRARESFVIGYGADHPATADMDHNLGSVLVVAGRQDEALEPLERAFEARKALFGEGHAKVGATLNALASAYYMAGDYEAALARYDTSYRIMSAKLDPGDVQLSRPLANMGRTLARMGRYDEAIERLSKAADVVSEAKGADHPDTAEALTGLGAARVEAGKVAEGLVDHERALEIRENKVGKDSPKTAESITNVADAKLRLGRTKEAVRGFERAVAIHEKAHKGDHPSLMESLVGLGEARVAAGDANEGLETLQRAETMRAALKLDDAHMVARLGMARARALWDAGGDREEAKRLAAGVRDSKDPAVATIADEAAKWLSERGSP